MPSILNATTSSGLVTSADNSGSLQLATNNGTTAVTIDTSQNVGVGTASPTARLHAQVSSGNTIARFVNTTSTGGELGELVLASPNRPAVRMNFQTSVDSNGFFNYDSSEYKFFANSGGSAVERMRLDSSGNLLFNSGYGSVATAYGCRAWVRFNGTGTVSILGSGNVSSITDNGTGQYTVNYSTSLPDTNYSIVTNLEYAQAQTRGVLSGPYSFATSSTALTCRNIEDNTYEDATTLSVAVFR
jgi:hypothetical protein